MSIPSVDCTTRATAAAIFAVGWLFAASGAHAQGYPIQFDFGTPATSQEIDAVAIAIPQAEVPDEDASVRMHEQIQQKIAAIPGVVAVGLSSSIPLVCAKWKRASAICIRPHENFMSHRRSCRKS